MKSEELALFTLESGRAFAERVARGLGVELAQHEEREFEWGHHKIRPLESVRGRDVYVVCSLHGDSEHSVNDKLCRLLFFLGALRDASAGRVTAVVPFLCYSRKERKTKSRDPVTSRYIAGLFEAVGADRVVTLEVHNVAAFQNAFRCRTEHLEAHTLFADYFSQNLATRSVAVVSPDVGGIKRAERYRLALETRIGTEVVGAFLEKSRSDDVVSGSAVVGDVSNRSVILVDDMISGGTTIARASKACCDAGARDVFAAAAHGVFTHAAGPALAAAPIQRIVVLDHVPPQALPSALVESKVEMLEGATLVAESIRQMHTNGSLVEILAS
jgi:ribose-phosphate pyrophosphokinase